MQFPQTVNASSDPILFSLLMNACGRDTAEGTESDPQTYAFDAHCVEHRITGFWNRLPARNSSERYFIASFTITNYEMRDC